jgi:hypothetical protein
MRKISTNGKGEMSSRAKLILKRIAVVIAFLFGAFLFAMVFEALRPALSTGEFISHMEDKGYIVESRVPQSEQATTHLVANTGEFYVEFMVYETMAGARYTFEQLRDGLEQISDRAASSWSSSGFNSWYEHITKDGQIAKMGRVRGTIVFIETTVENGDTVYAIWERLGLN